MTSTSANRSDGIPPATGGPGTDGRVPVDEDDWETADLEPRAVRKSPPRPQRQQQQQSGESMPNLRLQPTASEFQPRIQARVSPAATPSSGSCKGNAGGPGTQSQWQVNGVPGSGHGPSAGAGGGWGGVGGSGNGPAAGAGSGQASQNQRWGQSARPPQTFGGNGTNGNYGGGYQGYGYNPNFSSYSRPPHSQTPPYQQYGYPPTQVQGPSRNQYPQNSSPGPISSNGSNAYSASGASGSGGGGDDEWFRGPPQASNRQIWDSANRAASTAMMTSSDGPAPPAPKMQILRRSGAPSRSPSGPGAGRDLAQGSGSGPGGKTYTQREEEYRLARERIFGPSSSPPASGAASAVPSTSNTPAPVQGLGTVGTSGGESLSSSKANSERGKARGSGGIGGGSGPGSGTASPVRFGFIPRQVQQGQGTSSSGSTIVPGGAGFGGARGVPGSEGISVESLHESLSKLEVGRRYETPPQMQVGGYVGGAGVGSPGGRDRAAGAGAGGRVVRQPRGPGEGGGFGAGTGSGP